jgi:hypothetical protein
MFRKKVLVAPLVVSALVAAVSVATLGCDGKAHGTDLYGGTSGGASSSSGASSGTDPSPDRTCTSQSQPGDTCPFAGEGTCYSSYGTLICVDGQWRLDPTTIDYPPPPPLPSCPPYEPVEGQSCYTPGNGCSYYDACPDRPNGSYGSRYWLCSSYGGTWQRQDPYIARCPSVRPRDGESCAACAGSYPAQCTYFDGSGCGPAIVTCDPKTQSWSQLPTPCPPPPLDAGAGP